MDSKQTDGWVCSISTLERERGADTHTHTHTQSEANTDTERREIETAGKRWKGKKRKRRLRKENACMLIGKQINHFQQILQLLFIVENACVAFSFALHCRDIIPAAKIKSSGGLNACIPLVFFLKEENPLAILKKHGSNTYQSSS